MTDIQGKKSDTEWVSLENFVRPKGSHRRTPDELVYSISKSGSEFLGMLKIGAELAEQSRLRVNDKATLRWSKSGFACLEKTETGNRRLKQRGRWLVLLFPVREEMRLPMVGATSCVIKEIGEMSIGFLLPQVDESEESVRKTKTRAPRQRKAA